jgi:hypothetical protein
MADPLDDRPVLLAMNNPLSSDPRHALFPLPTGCTGNRIWLMLCDAAAERRVEIPSKNQYLAAFDRRNLLNARDWSKADARRAAGPLLDGLSGRVALILGAGTADACGLARGGSGWLEWRDAHRNLLGAEPLTYAVIPHPSGRCREYNDPEFRMTVARELLTLYLKSKLGLTYDSIKRRINN